MQPARFRGNDPLEADISSAYVRPMDTDESDVEVFERIPWEALEQNHDRRWAVYLVAGAVVLGAIGVTIGRGVSPPPAPGADASATVSVPATAAVPTPPADEVVQPEVTVAATPALTTTWSEADLMAVPAEDLEAGAIAIAEWFVVDYFTRDGSGEDGRSFVEWASVVEHTWRDASVLELTVAVRRLAALGDAAYQRIPVEGWTISTELTDDGWVVVGGPVPTEVEPPVLADPLAGSDEVPAEVAAMVDDGDVLGGHESDGRWHLEVEWVDAAGVPWHVTRIVEP